MPEIFPSRPTKAIIDHAALVENVRSIREFIGPGPKFMAVVKANAYGHGAIECSQTLEKAGVDWFGVATLEEAHELRKNGIASPITCFGSVWPGQETAFFEHFVIPAIFSLETAKRLDETAAKCGVEARVHLKLDTGMGRVGLRFDELEGFLQEIAELRHLRITGLMTHFAAADDLSQADFTGLQIARFKSSLELLRKAGLEPEVVDLANSPGAVVYPESRGKMVRIGGIMYGLGDDVLPRDVPGPKLKPVLSLVTKVAMVKRINVGESIGYGRSYTAEREVTAAVLPIGYNDGYCRALSGLSDVLIRGIRCRVLGRISMDWITVDATAIPNIEAGEEVVLIGSSGDETITAAELAGISGSISYEITCGIGSRVPRIHTK
ncbi:MAG: alanine racemase [Acidobacteria bacterium]|nr:alanine racemase [Acidobacteriota bacterium]